mmetsp:Transcript_70618/g.132147  ORF Transcript_70618/g.132147 Transcript_70618/m.132147 type:complete len:251 (+) Transcript_70618:102-854(+)
MTLASQARYQTLLLCFWIVASQAAEADPQPFNNQDVPSFIPGYPGIDDGTKLFTYKKDCMEIAVMIVLGSLYYLGVSKARAAQQIPSADALGQPLSQRHAPYDFRAGYFSCFDNLPVCLWSCCCTHIRMGDTYSSAGVTNFWMPSVVFILSRIIANIMGQIPLMPGGLPTFSMLFFQAIFFVGWRQELRRRLGAQTPTTHLLPDALFWTCCQPCASAQEAQDIDAAQGVQVGYCFSVTLVGEPLALQQGA